MTATTDPTNALATDSAERYSLIEMDPPKAAAPVAAPAVTVAPVTPASPLVAGRAALLGATHDTLGEAARKVATVCEAAGLDKASPVRTELRNLYRAILATFVWARIWASLSAGIQHRPSNVVRPAAPAAPVEPSAAPALLDTLAAAAALGGAGTTAGSMAGGQLAGAGYTSAAGYVTALAHGVKAATADSYRQTLRMQYGYTAEQIAALTVTLIVESALPVGAGVVHAPVGVAVHDMTPAQVRANFARPVVLSAEQKAAAEQAALAAPMKATLLHGLVESGRGLVVSPGRAQHGVVCPASDLRAALALIDRDDLAPRIKSSVAQFGTVMGALNGNGLRSWAAKRREAAATGESWPADVVSRWIVGTLNGGGQLGSLGDKELIAELTTAGEVQFTGGNAVLRGSVTEAFAVRVAEQAYNATDLLAWFRRVLRTAFHGVEWGGFTYCPGRKEQVAPIRAFIAAIKPLLGRTIGVGEAITDEGMTEGIGESFNDEIVAVERAYTVAKSAAANREYSKAHKAGLPAADCELAGKRAVVLSDAAGSRLDDLRTIATKIDGFAPMLGELTTKALRARIAALTAILTPLIDASSERFRNLELA